ncbi:MAG: rod shape-determining protein MreD, partial [Pseudomonadota bacterium]
PRARPEPAARWLLYASGVVALVLTIVPLPPLLALARPAWLALVLIYWAMFAPRQTGLAVAFVGGLLLDTLYQTPLGEHALALVLTMYLPLKFHLQLRVFPWHRLTATVLGLLIVYEFVLFWINGIAGLTTSPADYWLPVVTGTVIWPLIFLLLDAVRLRAGATT